MAHFTLLSGQRVIVHLRLHIYGNLVVGLFQIGIDECPKRRHAYGSRFHQPCIAIDTSSLIKPAFFECGIGTDANQVVAAVVYIFRHVIHLRGIAAGLGAHVKAIEPNAGIAEDAVELQGNMLAKVIGRDINSLPIPSHTRFRIFIANGLVAMRVACYISIG